MAIKKYLDEHGTEKVLAKIKNQIWRGTQAEWDSLSAAEKDKYEQAEIIGLDNNGVIYVVDRIEAGNMNPVTSNAVAKITSHGTSEVTWNTTYADPSSWSSGGLIEKCGIVQFTKIFTVKAGVPTGTVICSGLPKPAMTVEVPVTWDGADASGGFFLNANGELAIFAGVAVDTNCRVNLVYIKA